MREIKYRAYLKKSNQMVNVKSIHFGTNKIIVGYSKSKTNYGNYSVSFDDIELMQFTGLYDKNGKEIYEGDILQHEYNYCDKTDRYIVKWDGDNLQFVFENIVKKNTYMALEDFYDDYNGEYSISIIGNMYENSDLLGE